MSRRKKNAGKGFGMMFHGAFSEKADAKRKEREVHGFIQPRNIKGERRYVVMSERKNPIKRKKKKRETLPVELGTVETFERGTPVIREKVKVFDPRTGKWTTKTIKRNATSSYSSYSSPNPHELLVMGANPHEQHHDQEITLPPGATIVIRTPRQNPANPDRYVSAYAITKGIKKQAPGLIQTKRQKRVAGMVRGARRHKYEWIPSEGIAPGMNPGDDPWMYQALAELYPGKTLGQLSIQELSKVAQLAAQLKHPSRRQNSSAATLREEFTGAPAEYYTVHDEPHMHAGDYAELGKLLALYVKPVGGGQVQHITCRKPFPIVVSDESARQIWFVDGDQDVSSSLAAFGALDRGAGLFELGEARRIDYKQRKEHVKDPETDEWRHEFGEESGVRPVVLFDVGKRRLLLEGGAYEIRREGIVN